MKRKMVIYSLGVLFSSLILTGSAFSQDVSFFNLDLIVNKWIGSAHADAEAEAFTHWDEDGEIPTSCARCHSSPGYLDYLGDDGSNVGEVDKAAPIGTVIDCLTCHNESAAFLSEVTFPSGITITDLGPEARCMVCHQGRASGLDVDADIEAAGVTTDDEVSSELGFINIHYYATAATLYGGEVRGGYQYDGKVYDLKFDHVEGYNTCIGCHDQHSLQVRIDESVRAKECDDCHAGVSAQEDLRDIRMNGSMVDYDGDGDTSEGIAREIETLQVKLYQVVQLYASNVIGSPIIYDGDSYPYWFGDSNANGEVDSGESAFSNSYKSWSARLVRATFNYQVSLKDPGAFAHNAKYIIELLYDSIVDVNSTLASSNQLDTSILHRGDGTHFDGSKEASRHWDEDGEVPANCSKCHGKNGLAEFLTHDNTRSTEFRTDGMACINCHAADSDDTPLFDEIRDTGSSVTFPSGDQASLNNSSQLCMNCHQGRESKLDVDSAIAEGNFGFLNIHYYPAAALFFGTDVQGGYEYDGKVYAGQNLFLSHPPELSTCSGCHVQADDQAKHQFEPSLDLCNFCHTGDSFETLSGTPGANNIKIKKLGEQLFAELQSYAANTLGAPIVYDPNSYPYFFHDSNSNGVVDSGEASFGNRYTSFDAKALKAAYNYQVFQKEPCGYIHNGSYMGQLLFDSIENLGGTPSATRPFGN